MAKETAAERFRRRVVEKNAAMMEHCGVFLALFSKAYEKDPTALMQLGLAVVLDKPLLILVEGETPVPENVRRLARVIERYTGLDDLDIATKRLLERARELGL